MPPSVVKNEEFHPLHYARYNGVTDCELLFFLLVSWLSMDMTNGFLVQKVQFITTIFVKVFNDSFLLAVLNDAVALQALGVKFD